MIALLKGILAIKEPPVIVLDVQGVGYELKVPLSGFYDLPEIGQPATLFVHVVYREDAQNAYGFLQARDRDFFRELIRVNSVGPSLALTILSGLTVNECVQAVNDNDLTRLTKLPGIGKRTAERLVLELKPKLAAWGLGVGTASESTPSDRRLQDAESALLSLGYKVAEAKKALDSIAKSKDHQSDHFSSEDYIRTALRSLVRS